MLIRRQVAAGRFYPGEAHKLKAMLDDWLAPLEDTVIDDPAIVLAPHAGYIYSGSTAAQALRGVRPPATMILLCPNHTGLGHPLGVWPYGAWETPLGLVRVDEEIAAELCAPGPWTADPHSHLREHSLEVLLPFLQRFAPGNVPAIVPICLGTREPRVLAMAGTVLANVCGRRLRDGSCVLLVSSDMNHYENEARTNEKDKAALELVLAEDPDGLLDRCERDCITMCGCAPMALAMYCLREARGSAAPSKPARLLAYTTSGHVSGDFKKVVGYAAARLYL